MELIATENKAIQRKIKKVYDENKLMLPHLPLKDGFLQTINSVFKFLRWFGIPIVGGNKVITYFAIQAMLLIAVEMGALWKVYKLLAGKTLYSTGNRSVVARVSGSLFYFNAIVSLFLMLRFRKSWRSLSMEWTSVERSTGLYLPLDESVKMRMYVMIAIVALGSTFEHIMSMVSIIGLDCPLSEMFQKYVVGSHAFIIINSDYDIRLGVTLFIVGKTATAVWNVQDLILILISIGLSSRYRRLNRYVEEACSKLTSEAKSEYEQYIQSQAWRKVREAFVRQSALVKRADRDLGALIFLSNSNNFYFICLQVFNGIGSERTNFLDKAYFIVSFGWLMFRACAVVMSASEINHLSDKALKHLRLCPDECYNVEMLRLEKQLSKDYVVLSGKGFFFVDRNMLLQVAAAIFRYELVLLEYDR